MIALRLVYTANILIAGSVGVSSLLTPGHAANSVWQGTTLPGDAAVRVTGALWTALALLSVLGLRNPGVMVPVLLVQLLYKGMWLLAVAVPAMARGEGRTLPAGMAWVFLVWVAVLPFVIPFRELLAEPR